MKKLVLMGLMVLAAAPAFAKISSKVTVASDSSWRGLSLTGSGPAVQGGTTYLHDSGFGVGLYGSNQTLFTGTGVNNNPVTANFTNSSYLMAPYLMYGKDIGDINVSAMLIWMNFSPGGSNHNSTDIMISGAMAGAKLSVSYMPNYLGFETSDLYFNLSYKYELDKDFAVQAALGYTMFGDEKKTMMSSYMDWKLALQHTSSDGFTVELGLTDANYQALQLPLLTDKKDVTYTQKTYVSVTKAF